MMLVAFNANAQISGHVGYINSTMNQTISGNVQDPMTSNGFYVGGTFNVPLVSGLSVAPGAYFSFISNSSEDGITVLGITQNGKYTFTEMALNVPIHVNYGYELAADTKLFAYAGPTLSMGLKSTGKTVLTGAVENTSVADYYENGTYNKFNLYLGGGLGAKVAGIIITLGYDYGLLNLYAGDNENTKYTRANLHLGVGYAF